MSIPTKPWMPTIRPAWRPEDRDRDVAHRGGVIVSSGSSSSDLGPASGLGLGLIIKNENGNTSTSAEYSQANLNPTSPTPTQAPTPTPTTSSTHSNNSLTQTQSIFNLLASSHSSYGNGSGGGGRQGQGQEQEAGGIVKNDSTREFFLRNGPMNGRGVMIPSNSNSQGEVRQIRSPPTRGMNDRQRGDVVMNGQEGGAGEEKDGGEVDLRQVYETYQAFLETLQSLPTLSSVKNSNNNTSIHHHHQQLHYESFQRLSSLALKGYGILNPSTKSKPKSKSNGQSPERIGNSPEDPNISASTSTTAVAIAIDETPGLLGPLPNNPEPGVRCLGCGAVDTPEWRRGPMGPRTLCNACGLVFAKIIRKRSKSKQTGPQTSKATNANQARGSPTMSPPGANIGVSSGMILDPIERRKAGGIAGRGVKKVKRSGKV